MAKGNKKKPSTPQSKPIRKHVYKDDIIELYSDENIDIIIRQELQKRTSSNEIKVSVIDYIRTKLFGDVATEEGRYYKAGCARLPKEMRHSRRFGDVVISEGHYDK